MGQISVAGLAGSLSLDHWTRHGDCRRALTLASAEPRPSGRRYLMVLYTKRCLAYDRFYETKMRSTVIDTLPPKARRALGKLGADIALARKKRSLTTMMMAERLGVAKSTYLKIEKGDPTVAMGAYAMAFFVLGFDDALGEIIDAKRDEQGLLLDAERMPKRIRVRKVTSPL